MADAKPVTDDVGRDAGRKPLEDRQFLIEPAECAQCLGAERLDGFGVGRRRGNGVDLGQREGRAL